MCSFECMHSSSSLCVLRQGCGGVGEAGGASSDAVCFLQPVRGFKASACTIRDEAEGA